MHIGLDFDNTIVSYDSLFHKVALENGYINETIAASKVSVRDYLRSIDKELAWTEMQGYVYGARMDEATPYPGVLNCLTWARAHRIHVSIVSHKTQCPFIGAQYDLHAAARHWIDLHLNDTTGPLIPPENVFFELTKEAKVQRIKDIDCMVYVDDLPEILQAPNFPKVTTKILFDPDAHHSAQPLFRAMNWNEIHARLEQLWLSIQ